MTTLTLTEEEPQGLHIKFLNEGYGKRIMLGKWEFFNPHGFFSRGEIPNVQNYKVDWSTYNGKTVEVA